MLSAILFVGNALKVLKTFRTDSIDMVMTSPPYWGLRDYGVKDQLGLEPTPDDYVRRLIEHLYEIKRVLKLTGSLYLNLGDTYVKKNLQMIPSRVALALQKDGWILRNDIIWHKPNPMPASVKDRLTNTYEHLFHFVKSKKYYYDIDSIRIPHKTSPSSFNYRVREAKHGHSGIVGVKSNPKEMAEYDRRGQRMKTPDDYRYRTKFNKQCQASNLLARTAYARKVLGGDHETALNHPLGKNPGDVVSSPSLCAIELNRVRGKLRSNGSIAGHYLDLPFAAKHYAAGGKNPGDVMNIVSETRSKERLLNQRRRDLAEMRSEGRIHWELHPSKDPKWFNDKGKNPTDFWEIGPKPFPGAHFAVYPETLCIMPIKSSCPTGGVVLDPFAGSGTTMKVALDLGRNAIGIELNAKYARLARHRIKHNVKLKWFAS